MTEPPKFRALATARRLFEELEAREVSYCHWKSNLSLDRSLLGEGDLDLLIDEDHRHLFEEILEGLGFIRMLSTGLKRFEGLEDFLGMDHGTGRLIHLHVHYRLVLGEKRVKNHHLPLEQWLLTDSRMLEVVRVPRPEQELFLLYLRSLLKSDVRACLRAARLRSNRPFPRGVHEELRWLADQVDTPAVLNAALATPVRVREEHLREFLARVRSDRLTPSYVLRQKRAVLRALAPYQRYPPPIALARKAWCRYAYSRPARFFHPIPRKRLPGRGLYIGVTGADGSGKSSLAVDLQSWLSWKLCCSHVYFGQPKRSRATRVLSLSRRFLQAGSAAADRVRARRLSAGLSQAAQVTGAARWVHLARRRARLDREAQRRIDDGEIVIAERFPLRDFWTMLSPMDGPRLTGMPPSDRSSSLAAREQRHYEALSEPDLVILLRASLQTVRTRKPQTPTAEIEAKVEAVSRAAESGRYEVIDAEKPYDQVLLAAKHRIWQELLQTNDQRRRGPAGLPLGEGPTEPTGSLY
jgi:hypothetical protein